MQIRFQKVAVVIIVGISLIVSCRKSFLEKQPVGQLQQNSVTNRRGIENLLIGAYALLDGIGSSKSGWFSSGSNWLYGSICGSEAYVGSDDYDGSRHAIVPLEKFKATPYNEPLASKWATVYDGVQRANQVLKLLDKVKELKPDERKEIAGEARFLRAHYHFEAKKLWNRIPFVDEMISYEKKNYYVTNDKDAWPNIEADLKFAIDSLQPTPRLGAVGRATKFTAMALLAKAYMFQKKFAQAKPLLDSIIMSGTFRLVNYSDNFNPETRNNNESIFSVQMSVNDGADALNGNYGDVLNFPMGGLDVPGGCCGFFSPSQYLVNHFKTDPLTGLPDLENFNSQDVTSDEGWGQNDPFTPYSGTLDPRLDWTVGRRGIPYLDWGLHPGGQWTRADGGPYSPKKNVYYKSQQGLLTEVSYWTRGITTNNINLIRFADVLLWAAEAEVEIGNLEKAREYVNVVRSRAADQNGWVKKDDGSYAANYKIATFIHPWTDPAFARKAIRYERMLELGMEGHRFFDLVRWGVADIEINAYLQKEKHTRAYLNDAVFKKNCNEYFPIPQAQIDLSKAIGISQGMTQNACN